MERCIFSVNGECALVAAKMEGEDCFVSHVKCDGTGTDRCPFWEITAELDALTRAVWAIADAINAMTKKEEDEEECKWI